MKIIVTSYAESCGPTLKEARILPNGMAETKIGKYRCRHHPDDFYTNANAALKDMERRFAEEKEWLEHQLAELEQRRITSIKLVKGWAKNHEITASTSS